MKLIEQLSKLDIGSEEWAEVFNYVYDRHWNTEPAVNDDYFRAAKLLAMIVNRDVPDLTILTATIAKEAFEILETKKDACTAEIHVGEHRLFFRLAKSKDAIDNLQKMLANTVIVKAQPATDDKKGET